MEASTSTCPATSKEEALREQERPEAEYINSKCVLFTYLNGNINALVDEHFSRALSNYNPDARSTRGRKGSTGSSEGSLNERSFPASFWDSDYQTPSTTCTASGSCIGSPHTELQLTPTDHYPAALHPHLAQPPDHWHYPLAGPLSPQSPAYHQARTIHELYPVGPNLDPRYGSLLVPALRANRLQPTLSAQEPSSPWSGVFPTAEVTQTLNLNVDAARHYCIPRGSFFS